MQIMKHILLIAALLFASALYAQPMSQLLTVPFQNILLSPNHTIQANYAFGQQPIIFCYENNLQSVGVVTWPYKGQLQSSTLSISLITNGKYQGSFADATGTITVTNNQPIALIVNCVYGF